MGTGSEKGGQLMISQSVQLLERNYAECYNILGELLATLRMPSNRERLQADASLLKPVFDIIDNYHRQFSNLQDIDTIRRQRHGELHDLPARVG